MHCDHAYFESNEHNGRCVLQVWSKVSKKKDFYILATLSVCLLVENGQLQESYSSIIHGV